MDRILYNILNQYFNTLTKVGYIRDELLYKILVVLYIYDCLNNDFRYFITEKDIKLMQDVLYQFFDSACEISFPYDVRCCCCGKKDEPEEPEEPTIQFYTVRFIKDGVVLSTVLVEEGKSVTSVPTVANTGGRGFWTLDGLEVDPKNIAIYADTDFIYKTQAVTPPQKEELMYVGNSSTIPDATKIKSGTSVDYNKVKEFSSGDFTATPGFFWVCIPSDVTLVYIANEKVSGDYIYETKNDGSIFDVTSVKNIDIDGDSYKLYYYESFFSESSYKIIVE